MKFDEIKAIDIIEHIREYLLIKEPLVENTIQTLRGKNLEERSIDFYKEALAAVEFKIDVNTASGRRKIKTILRHIEKNIHDSRKVDNKFLTVKEENVEFNYIVDVDINFIEIIRKFESTIYNIDNKNSLKDPFLKLLNSCNGLKDTILFITHTFPNLKGLKAFKFLKAIGYPTGIPDSSRLRFFKRIGFLENTSDKTDIYFQYHFICHQISSITNEKILLIDYLLGLFTGSEKYGEKQLGICLVKPHCNECPIRNHCLFFNYSDNSVKLLHPSIKHWEKNLRPRERFEEKGSDSLSDAELLALIIRTGYKNNTALDLASQLLKKFKSISGIDSCSISELNTIKGIGKAKAIEIKAALALSRRFLSSPNSEKIKISNSSEIFDYFYPKMINLKQEIFFIILLNTKNKIIKEIMVSKGSLSSSIVHPREAFKEAIKESAASVIFIHNHPSGDPTPSKDDELITSRLKEAGELIGIKVLDHIIIAGNKYYSFADESSL